MASEDINKCTYTAESVRNNGNNLDNFCDESLANDTEGNWGFSLDDLYKLALQFYKG